MRPLREQHADAVKNNKIKEFWLSLEQTIEKRPMDRIDTLIAKLQAQGYKITISNYDIGDIHNLFIYKAFPTEKYKTYRIELIERYKLSLPSGFTKMIEILEDLLKKAN